MISVNIYIKEFCVFLLFNKMEKNKDELRLYECCIFKSYDHDSIEVNLTLVICAAKTPPKSPLFTFKTKRSTRKKRRKKPCRCRYNTKKICIIVYNFWLKFLYIFFHYYFR